MNTDRFFQTEELERRLESQDAMRQLVRELPEESVSLAWRSQLNEKLLAEAAKPARRPSRMRGLLRPAFGLAAALVLGALVLWQPKESQTVLVRQAAPADLEAALLSAHRRDSSLRDVAGYGLSVQEASSEYRAQGVDPSFEIDLSPL